MPVTGTVQLKDNACHIIYLLNGAIAKPDF